MKTRQEEHLKKKEKTSLLHKRNWHWALVQYAHVQMAKKLINFCGEKYVFCKNYISNYRRQTSLVFAINFDWCTLKKEKHPNKKIKNL